MKSWLQSPEINPECNVKHPYESLRFYGSLIFTEMWTASTTHGWTPRVWEIVLISRMITYHDWVVVSKVFYFHPENWGVKTSNLTSMFFRWVGSTTNQMNDHDISSSTHQIPILTASLTLGDEREALKQVFLGTKKGWTTGNPNEQWKKKPIVGWVI